MLGFAELEVSGNFTYGVLGVYIVTFLQFLSNPSTSKNGFKTVFVLYFIWMMVCILLGNVILSPAVLHALFFVVTFYFCFQRCSQNDVLKQTIIGFIALFFVLSYFYISNLVENETIMAGRVGNQSNLIYWIFMLIPFILLLKDGWLKTLLLIVLSVMTLISLKRGALIAFAIILLYYLKEIFVLYPLKRYTITIALVAGAIFVVSYFQIYADAALSRFDSMKDDEGSGRYVIWNSVFALLHDNNFFEWIFGNGEGSITKSGHTSGHNDFLHILYQYGIIGVIFYIVVVARAFKTYLFARKHIPQFSVACFSAFVTLIVVGLISDLWVSYSYFAFITSFWGCMEGYISRFYNTNAPSLCSA